MQSRADLPALVVVLGATAVGKTQTALALAEQLGGEIISADARTFYRGMDIGTAKPSLEDRARVRHHLIDVADPDDTWSLMRFQRAAGEAIESINQAGRTPILVGGSGQYIRAVSAGWRPPQVAPRPGLRAVLEDWAEEIGVEEMHRRLARLDAEAAGNMERRNLRRIVRALEVIFSSGRRFSEQQAAGETRYRTLQIGLSRKRELIYARIDARLEAMMAAGFLGEVQGLLDAGYSPELPSFSAIGYRQLAEHLAGKIGLEEALREIRRVSRRFVRRQSNWFKADDRSIHWFDLDGGGDVGGTIHQLVLDWSKAAGDGG